VTAFGPAFPTCNWWFSFIERYEAVTVGRKAPPKQIGRWKPMDSLIAFAILLLLFVGLLLMRLARRRD
jgi:hypothetical protein